MTPSTRNALIAAPVIFGAAFWFSTSYVSSADVGRYGAECKKWISTDFADGADARIGDHWKKRGNLVFEVLVADADKSSASIFLCVVDTTKGTMRKPSAFDTSWR